MHASGAQALTPVHVIMPCPICGHDIGTLPWEVARVLEWQYTWVYANSWGVGYWYPEWARVPVLAPAHAECFDWQRARRVGGA